MSTFRIVESQDSQFILTNDGIFKLNECFSSEKPGGKGYRILNLSRPSLSKSVMRKVFKVRKGKTRAYHFEMASDRQSLRIGCQTFGPDAVLGMQHWLGID